MAIVKSRLAKLAVRRCSLLAAAGGLFGGLAFFRPPAMNMTAAPAHLHHPQERDTHYGSPMNVAQYLTDLHDAGAVFNFCGSLPFQLSLSPILREHLGKVAEAGTDSEHQPQVYDASMNRLFNTPGYSKVAEADNIRVFHGREIRQVPHANGGGGCILQLSMANEADPEGWTKLEIGDYNGWAHDTGRPWRRGEQLEREGFEGFQAKFGDAAYGLHHRFYLHLDHRSQIWLSAEDGCEGEPWGYQ